MKAIFSRIGQLFRGLVEILRHGKSPDKQWAWVAVVVILIIIGNLCYNAFSPNAVHTITTSEFIEQLDAGNIESMSINDSDGSVAGTFTEATEDGVVNFKTTVPSYSEVLTEKYLSTTTGIEYDYNKPSTLVSYLWNLVAIVFQVGLLVIAMGWLLSATMGSKVGNILPFGNKTIDVVSHVPETTFDDVWGIPEAKEEVKEIIAFLKASEVYDQAGADFPRGVLLAGPSGTGKTLLAKALAGEAGVPFIAASGSDFVELYVGMGAKRIREVFEKAREEAPSILFIDEIDAIGSQRGDEEFTGGHNEREQTLNQLLVEMDGFKSSSKVIVIAATNRLNVLDKALIRPGRFDRIITVDKPAKEGRKEILQHYAQGRPFAQKVDFDLLAAHTYGLSGAELQNTINQAATLAARRAIDDGTNEPMITMEDLEEGISRTICGPAIKSRKLTDKEKKQVAYHEAGHAVVQHLLPDCEEVQKISIVSRNIPGTGTALGFVQSYSEDDRYVVTSEQIQSQITALLAGRVAEKMFCNIETAGANDDLEKASKLAYDMADKYAFSRVGTLNNDSLRTNIHRRNSAAQNRLETLDELAESALASAYSTAERLLTLYRQHVEAIVSTLLERETIDAEEIKKIMIRVGDDINAQQETEESIGQSEYVDEVSGEVEQPVDDSRGTQNASNDINDDTINDRNQ